MILLYFIVGGDPFKMQRHIHSHIESVKAQRNKIGQEVECAIRELKWILYCYLRFYFIFLQNQRHRNNWILQKGAGSSECQNQWDPKSVFRIEFAKTFSTLASHIALRSETHFSHPTDEHRALSAMVSYDSDSQRDFAFRIGSLSARHFGFEATFSTILSHIARRLETYFAIDEPLQWVAINRERFHYVRTWRDSVGTEICAKSAIS